MKIAITKLHYKTKFKFMDYFIIPPLYFISLFYAFAVNCRNLAYKKEQLKKFKPNALVISVGNLTTGGVGKTPIVAEIANYLKNEDRKIAILSRGYGGKLNTKNINVISDSENIFFDAEKAGDEPLLLAKKCQGIAILTCRKRILAANYATEKLNCNTIILDDAYQHQAIERDINILVIDYEKKFGNKLLLPAGPLREPLKEINRANKIVIVNKTNSVIEAESFCKKIEKTYKKPTFLCNMVFDKIYNISTKQEISSPQKLIAFSAIGQPQQFYNQLIMNGYNIITNYSFNDHHIYTLQDLKNLQTLLIKTQADNFITTEKDAVKIKKLLDDNNIHDEFNILVVSLKPQFAQNNDLENLVKIEA